MRFYISCEGETERWYFEWLQRQINKDKRTREKIDFCFKNISPSSFAKSNKNAFTNAMIEGTKFCRVQDIEDYSECQIKAFHNLLKSNKEAKNILKKVSFIIGYSNYTFEVWIIAHKTKVKSVAHRDHYYRQINSAFGKKFENNCDYKSKSNFESILKLLTLDDVINNALPECQRFKSKNSTDDPQSKRSMYGFTYMLKEPDTTLDDFVKIILKCAEIIQ